MKIGPIDMPPGAALAPMAGVTDMPFRRICRALGASWTVSEMISAKGYLSAPREMHKVTELLTLGEGEGIVGLQLFGHEPHIMAEAAARLSSRAFAFIDINMGCPAHKIVSGGDGSALMKKPELAGKIVEAVVKSVSKPVTVKLRAGYDEWHQNALEVARIVESAGAGALTLHARTREQFYSGRADWSTIEKVAGALKIPVVGNGDVASGADALKMMRETGCAGIMVGRAAGGNPWIFAEILAAMAGEPYEAPGIKARMDMAIHHLSEEVALRGEKGAVLMMRGQIAQYVAGIKGAAKLRAQINALTKADDVRQVLMSVAREME